MIPEKSYNKVAHWVQWSVATFIAGITFITYVHGYVYSRSEGERLEKQIEQLENNTKNDLKEMRQKIDSIYEILISMDKRSRHR